MNNLRTCPVILLLISSISHYAEAFVSPFTIRQYNPLTTLQASVAVSNDVKGQVSVIKRVLAKEYTSFFDPMETQYYADDVTFEDPLTSLDGVASYQKNVDMLAGRTLMGSILFDDAKINLHNVSGGEVDSNDEISDITTRWTLRVTAKILPWKPTATFSGISVYKLGVIDNSVKIVGQKDYWDSINLRPDASGSYEKVDKSIALDDFLGQLKPGGLQAQQSAAELPYELLRRGNGYEVRRYPETVVVEAPYTRRDEGYDLLGSVTRGMRQFAPAVMTVGESKEKSMCWYVGFALPGQDVKVPTNFEGRNGAVIKTQPSKIIGVGRFNDAALEPIVRKCDAELRKSLTKDGLKFVTGEAVQFAQYDAVYSLGDRRGEVWLELEEGSSPW